MPRASVTRISWKVPSGSTLALLLVAGTCALLVGQRLVARLEAQTAFESSIVLDMQGKRVPLVRRNEPTIVMVNSRTCPWCKKALADLGEMAAGRAVPRLTVLTLEGAEFGVPMLAKEKLQGARIVGPAGSREQALMTYRYPGTPTFVAIDGKGRIVHTIPGYPIRPELERLLSVMLGDADVP